MIPTMTELDDVPEIRKPFDKLPEEPIEWYSRFQMFLLAGIGRSVTDVYRKDVIQGNNRSHKKPAEVGKGQRIHVPGNWKAAVERWEWHERAQAWDQEQLESERVALETDRLKRRRTVIERGWTQSQLLLDMAEESLKHGHKFFERTTRVVPGKPEMQEVVNPKTGRKEMMLVRVDREIVYLEHRLNDLIRAMSEGEKRARMSVNMTTDKEQAKFETVDVAEVTDAEAIDKELQSIFEQLGMNKPLPTSLQAGPQVVQGEFMLGHGISELERPVGPDDLDRDPAPRPIMSIEDEPLPGFDD